MIFIARLNVVSCQVVLRSVESCPVSSQRNVSALVSGCLDDGGVVEVAVRALNKLLAFLASRMVGVLVHPTQLEIAGSILLNMLKIIIDE